MTKYRDLRDEVAGLRWALGIIAEDHPDHPAGQFAYGALRVGFHRPPEEVFAYFRRLHGVSPSALKRSDVGAELKGKSPKGAGVSQDGEA